MTYTNPCIFLRSDVNNPEIAARGNLLHYQQRIEKSVANPPSILYVALGQVHMVGFSGDLDVVAYRCIQAGSLIWDPLVRRHSSQVSLNLFEPFATERTAG